MKNIEISSQPVYNIYCLKEYGDIGYYITDYESRFTHSNSFLSLLGLMEYINSNDIILDMPYDDNYTVLEYVSNRSGNFTIIEHIEKDKTIDELLHKYVYYII